AILTLLQGAPEKLNFDDRRAERFTERFEQMVDQSFFPDLFASLDVPATSARHNWVATLLASAHTVVEDAVREAPIPIARRHRAIAVAQIVFRGAARRNFPDNFEPPQE